MKLHVLTIAVSLSLVACVPPSQQDPSPASAASGDTQASAAASPALKPSARGLEIARGLGFPQVTPDADFAGPFDGPQGTIVYAARSGKVTFFDPNTAITYMAALAPPRWVYIMAPQGFYVVQGEQVTQVANPPADIGSWPVAEAAARVAIATRKQQLASNVQPANTGKVPWGAMSNMSANWHQTNMQIINNIGGGGCTNHYEGPYFVGCY